MIFVQILLTFVGILDLLPVVASPALSFFGDITLYPFARRLRILPTLILASQISSSIKGSEATLYSLFMSLINLGETVGIFFGNILFRLGTEENYHTFAYAILAKGLLRLSFLPFLFICFREYSKFKIRKNIQKES
jgi:hypothetical protein